MEAPLYPPAREYREPQLVTEEFGVDSAAVADLLAAPATRAILLEEVPGIERIASVPMLQPHLTNFTLRTMTEFGMVQLDVLPRVDARLRALPVNERPGL